MSSTKSELRGSPAVRSPRTGRRVSIAGRQAWLNVAATVVLLLAAEAFLYWGLERSLQVESERLLATKLDIVRFLVSDPAKIEELRDEIEHEAGSGHAAKYYIRVVLPSGRPLLETPEMRELVPPDLFPPLSPGSDVRGPNVVFRENVGHEFTLITGRAVTGNLSERTLQIAQDVSVHRAILAGTRQRLAIVFVVGLAFAAVAGWIVIRISLMPLREIAETAQHITASRLNERLDPATWPDELRHVAAAFDAMLDRLQESFNRLTEFSADLAHALRNPINNLRGETEVALTRARTPEEYRQTLGSGLEELERLSRLIEGLLFLARADDPRIAIEKVRFEARREMDAVREFYDAVAAEAGIGVTCQGAAEITGDPMLVRRAISNLLGNALKHTARGGCVMLSATEQTDGGALIEVIDNGTGIPTEHLPRVFERFYQVDKAHPAARGAGLGLAIVQSIMRLHGGAASLERVSDGGMKATLRFVRPTDTKTNPVFT